MSHGHGNKDKSRLIQLQYLRVSMLYVKWFYSATQWSQFVLQVCDKASAVIVL